MLKAKFSPLPTLSPICSLGSGGGKKKHRVHQYLGFKWPVWFNIWTMKAADVTRETGFDF